MKKISHYTIEHQIGEGEMATDTMIMLRKQKEDTIEYGLKNQALLSSIRVYPARSNKAHSKHKKNCLKSNIQTDSLSLTLPADIIV